LTFLIQLSGLPYGRHRTLGQARGMALFNMTRQGNEARCVCW